MNVKVALFVDAHDKLLRFLGVDLEAVVGAGLHEQEVGIDSGYWRKWEWWNVTDLFSHLVGSGVLTELVLKTATILQLVDTDVGGDTTREQSVRTKKHQTFDIVGLTSVN